MNFKPKHNIFNTVINQDLCVGCGACVYYNTSSDWKMEWNKEGFIVPTENNGKNEMDETAINVCPFNPYPVYKVRTEDELSEIFLRKAPNFHPRVGRYNNTYAGHSEQFRLTSSSGGIATYILNELFEQKLVDAVITVGEGENNHYEYKFVRSNTDLLATSKTKYYPVTMAEVLKELRSFNGKVAVVGIGCFIKAVRLLQHYNPELSEKIVFTIGIICGGLKSKFFGEYLAAKSEVQNNEFTKPQFRIKDLRSTAEDYSFGCIDNKGNEKQVKMRKVGDMWGSGMFKCNACDFCDDVTTELADVSLGDAWLPPYNQDGKGTNVIVTRSQLADDLIQDGIEKKELSIKPLAFDTFLASQQGSFNHRHKALRYRVKLAKKRGITIPPKRHDNEKISLDFKLVQKKRLIVRKQSILEWTNAKDSTMFDKAMYKQLEKLQRRTVFNHYIRAIKRRLGL